MTRNSKIAFWIVASLMGVILAAASIAVVVLRTEWFRDYVKAKIISSVEDSTGGKVDLKSFTFDWRGLKAQLTGFVIHGTEPAGSPPLFEAPSITLRLKLLSLHQAVDLEYLGLDQPHANVMVFGNGDTNIPAPKAARSTNKSGLETIVDLAIHRIDVNDGVVQFLQQKEAFSARGQDLRIALSYVAGAARYQGEVSMRPLYVTSGNRPRLELKLTVPIELERDKIQVRNAKLEAPESSLTLTGTVEHLASPQISGQLDTHLSLEELTRSFELPIHPRPGSGPQALDAILAIRSDQRAIEIQTAQLTLGRTHLEAAGDLRHAAAVRGDLSLDELGTLLQIPQIRHGSMPVSANVRVEPDLISIDDLKLAALGGEIVANARLANLSAVSIRGNLSAFQLTRLTEAFLSKPIAYGGSISGTVQVDGDLKVPDASGWGAHARLSVGPAGSGTPVSGRINADYSGARGLIVVKNSQISLPATRIDLAGELGRQAHVQIVSRDLSDFDPAIALFSSTAFHPQVKLRGGTANLTADAQGGLTSPDIQAHLNVTNFVIGERPFNQLSADVRASPSGVGVQNGVLTRNGSLAQFSASVGLADWTAGAAQPVTSTITLRNSDLVDILALSGQSIPARGLLNADVRISGTVGNPQGTIQASILNGTAYQEPFDSLKLAADLTDQLVTVKTAELVEGNARVDVQGTFRHPPDSFETGRVHALVTSTSVELGQLAVLQKQRPGLSGLVGLSADATGDLRQSGGEVKLVPVTINADLKATNIRDQGQSYGDLTATVRTQGADVNTRVDSNFAGSTVQLTGRTRLLPDYPTTAQLELRGLQIQRALRMAMPAKQIPVQGVLSARAQASGTLKDPQATLSFDLTNAVIDDQPVNRVNGAIEYNARLLNILSLQATAPAGHMDLRGSLSHSGFDFDNGHAELHLSAPSLDLRQVQPLQKARPGITGNLRTVADVSVDFRKRNGQREVLPSRVDVNGGATAVQWNGQPLGDITFHSETHSNTTSLTLDSNLAKSQIHGSGEVRLGGDYPVDGKVTLANLTYAAVKPLLATSAEVSPNFDALVEGQISVKGPAIRPREIRTDLQLTKVELFTRAPGNSKTTFLQNEGVVTAHLDQSQVRIDSARFTGPSTNLSVSGNVGLGGSNALNVAVNGDTDLGLLKSFSKDIYSGGNLNVKATVRGTFAQPLANGTVELKNASLILPDWPLGMSNANGIIDLNGTALSIRKLDAEAGGGKLTLTGFAGFTGTTLNYNVRGNAANVRTRYSNASVLSNADLTLTGTSTRSLLSGNVTVERVSYSQESDFGSILTQSATPPQASSTLTGPTVGMRLNIRIRTAPDVRFQTNLAQDLDATADLTLRGTLASPGLTGRISITRGQLVFFGNKYDVNRGSVAFYNALKIDPTLDVSLETSVQGVDVTLQVSGPIDNLKLNYQSDPPLRFEDIVALLATGKTPPDPNIAANQPYQPDQSVTQMGESAILGQAVASPLASRLQRVFGVTQLRIDPTFVSGSTLPQARVTLQQQVTSAITFTYTEDLTQTNAQIIRVEWALSPKWSAVAIRDELGLFGIDFVYKKQFH